MARPNSAEIARVEKVDSLRQAGVKALSARVLELLDGKVRGYRESPYTTSNGYTTEWTISSGGTVIYDNNQKPVRHPELFSTAKIKRPSGENAMPTKNSRRYTFFRDPNTGLWVSRSSNLSEEPKHPLLIPPVRLDEDLPEVSLKYTHLVRGNAILDAFGLIPPLKIV